jgi:hypothetical protein
MASAKKTVRTTRASGDLVALEKEYQDWVEKNSSALSDSDS